MEEKFRKVIHNRKKLTEKEMKIHADIHPLDKKEHFNKLLDRIDTITSQLNHYRDDPDAVIGMIGVALKPFEKANTPITAYVTLLDYIDILYGNSKDPISLN